MAEFGPISLIAIGFPNIEKLKGDLLREIFKLSEARIIRVIGLLAIVKDGSTGEIASVQITDLSKEDRVKLGAAIGSLIGYGAAGEKGAIAGAEAGAQTVAAKDFGLTQSQIREVAKSMPRGTAAGFMLVEHLWAKKFKEIAQKQDGVLLANGFISPQDLVAVGAHLAEGARVAERVSLE